MIHSTPEQCLLSCAALPVDVAVDCALLRPMPSSWLIRCAKLSGCGKQTACVLTEAAAALNQCLLFKALSDFQQHSSPPSSVSGKP